MSDKYAAIPANGPIESYFSYNGKRLTIQMPIVGITNYWYPLLLTSYNNGILLIEQFSGGPSRRPKEFRLSYDIPNENLGGWFYGQKGEISNVLLTSTADKLLFTYQKQIHLLDPATGKEIKVFNPELPSIFKASLDLSNNLIIHGIDTAKNEVVCAFNLDGTKLWEHRIEGSIQNNQPPVCGENGAVFFISDSSLYCIISGETIWKEEVVPCVTPLLTSSKGNNIIVQSGIHILAFDANGKNIFSKLITKDINEEFTAPPVIGGDGRIYVASGTALYCFK
jgi:outer membrane protein assembly factor BamB